MKTPTQTSSGHYCNVPPTKRQLGDMHFPMNLLSVTVIDQVLDQIGTSSSKSGEDYLLGLPSGLTGIDITAIRGLVEKHQKALQGELGRKIHPVVALLDFVSTDTEGQLATPINDFCILKKSALRDLVNAALYDNLTGLYSRNILEARLHEEFQRARRYDIPLSVLFIDIDSFKTINDTYGHAEGDRALAYIGQFIRNHLRGVDFPVRYGGEEFVIILPHTDGKTALSLAQRIHKGIEKVQGNQDLRVPITLSIGVGTLVSDIKTQDQLIDAADKAVYKAKKAGKNMVWPVPNGGPDGESDDRNQV